MSGNVSAPRLFKTPTESHIEGTEMNKFRLFVNSRHGLDLKSYAELHKYSIDSGNSFFCDVWDYTGMIGQRGDLVSSLFLVPWLSAGSK